MQGPIDKANVKAIILRYLNIISNRRYLFFTIFAIVTIVSVAYSYTIEKEYKAFETILVEKEKIINPLMHGLAVSSSSAERLNTIRQLILSRSRLLQVIRKLDLDLSVKTPLELEGLIEGMRKATQVELKGKNLYCISYEGNDPEVVKNVVSTVCGLFIEENLGETRGAAHEAFSFIETQLSIYKRKLEESENALRLFKEENLGQSPGEKNINLSKLQQYQSLLAETEIELKEAQMQKSLLEKQLSLEKPLILAFSSSSNNSPEAQLAQLNAQLGSLLTQYTANYPDVIDLKERIENIKQNISKRGQNRDEIKKNGNTESTTEALNPAYQKLKEDLGHINIKIKLCDSRITEYNEKITFYEDKVKSIPTQEQDLARLTRGYDVDASLYKTLLNKLEEARISRELELNERMVDFQIIDAAQLPLVPSKPNRPKLILIGLFIGFLAAFFSIYAFQYLDSSIIDLDDARNYFKYPVLANIPLTMCDDDIKKNRKSDLIFFSIAGTFIVSILILLIKELLTGYMLLK